MKRRAFAKINLSLRVEGKRPDGFHEISTLMCPISLADEVTLEKTERPGIEFHCNRPDLPADGSNLVEKAAALFFEEVGVAPRVRIELDKRIPSGAGLGGGSSDAAATLEGLDALFGTGLGEERLTTLGGRLGSDVPFFFHRQAALCEGRGERVTPVDYLPSLDVLLLKPGFEVSTPWAYSRWKHAVEVPGFAYEPQTMEWGELVNDLERPVFEKYLLLGLMKEWLLEQEAVVGALMSGSGATIFAILGDGATGKGLEAAAKSEFGPGLWTWTGQSEATHT